MRQPPFWTLLVGLLLLGAAFLLLDFRVAASSTQAIQTIITTELAGNYPDPPQRDDKISLVVVGDSPLVSALQKELAQQVDKAALGTVELAQGLAPTYKNPVLVVEVGKPGLLWTPFFAQSQFSIRAAYASNGDTTFLQRLDETLPYIPSPDPSAVNLYTKYEGGDRSYGLISRLGYHRYLADYLSREIVNALKNLYNIQDI